MARSRKKDNKPYEEGSPAEFIVGLLSLSWNKIKPLTESQLISDKLLAFHIIIFTMISGTVITHLWLSGDSFFSLGGLLILFISFVIAFIVSNLYGKLMELLVNLVINKINAIRISSVILLSGVPLAAGGLFFNFVVLTKIALGIIAIQLLFILFSNLFNFSTSDVKNKGSSTSSFKDAVGKTLFIIMLIEFGLSVILFLSAIISGELF